MRVTGGSDASVARLLPWTGTGGKPCYVVGDGTGYVSRKADEVEEIQLDMAYELLGHADGLLTEPGVTAPEIHFLASRLSECLEQVQRIAESRGSRLEAVLPQPEPEPEPQSRSATSP
ncbi:MULTISPECIES: hypothetical protein [unclassified Streptomyces]|uniref:hypothetical protein n=1 Tax=unclassified Streptomyces TaxID=2593676 RepID=UPI000978F6A5|nr:MULTISPECIES: hypothetical protein [unclassified Streptomyces]ONI54110.1 hypothetical protein STIB_18210 [Streptomyces sp. IB2014 011-1]RDV52316.1 hypothetical protein DDV98_09070 [Streptomyces sp. IB2014 011-12]